MKNYFWALILFAGWADANPPTLNITGSATIQSNESTIDLRTGVNTFIGDVKVDHLAFDLYADKLVEVRDNGNTKLLTAIGTPARFNQDLPFSEQISHGHAEKIVYDGETKEIRMWNYVITDIDGNVMKGQTVTYVLLENTET